MAIKFKKGDLVRQVTPAPLEGTVVQTSLASDEVIFLVRMPDESLHWFKEDEIELKEGDTG